MQKLTLEYIWYECVWRAYNTQFSCAYDKKFVAVPMIRIYPTTLILPSRSIYTPKSILAISIPRVFIFI